jgi:hypothetical protein
MGITKGMRIYRGLMYYNFFYIPNALGEIKVKNLTQSSKRTQSEAWKLSLELDFVLKTLVQD